MIEVDEIWKEMKKIAGWALTLLILIIIAAVIFGYCIGKHS